MNITQATKGENLISIKIAVEKADYEENVNNALKQLRRKANVPGFRPGMVPMGMIKRMYGASAKMEELNKLVSDNLNKYIFDNHLNLIGYPLSDLEQQQPNDLESQDDMDFYFEAALRPEINIDYTNTMVEFYHIVAEEEDVQRAIDDMLERNPNTSHPETVGENDRLELKVREAKDGQEVEGGFERDGFYIHMDQIKDKECRDMLIGKEVGSEFIFNFAKALESEEAAAKLLGEGAPAASDFNIIIDDASRDERPELDEEFFAIKGKGAYGPYGRLEAKGTTELQRAVVSTGFPYDKATNPDNNLDRFAQVMPRVRGIRRLGSAAMDLSYVAAGWLDGYWELNLKEWDACAGELIALEAGAVVKRYREDHGICILAACPGIAQQLLDMVE